MEMQEEQCRGRDALVGYWAYRKKEQKPLTGRRVLVDLDEGKAVAATLNEYGLSEDCATYPVAAVLNPLADVLAACFDESVDSIRAYLSDQEEMRISAETIQSIMLTAPDADCMTVNGKAISWTQLSRAMDALEGTMLPTAELAASLLDGIEEDDSLLLYGACAGFYPLQLLFRRLFSGMPAEAFLPLALLPEPLLRCVADDGSFARAGSKLLETGEASIGPPGAPVRLTIQLIDREGKTTELVLAEKNQAAEALPGETPTFYLRQSSPIHLTADNRSIDIKIPKRFFSAGSAQDSALRRVNVSAALAERNLLVTVTDLDNPANKHTFVIGKEDAKNE